MGRPDLLRVYTSLADDLFRHQVKESSLRFLASNLPPLDERKLKKLAEYAGEAAFTQPRRGWSIMRVGYEVTASHDSDLFLTSLAAWYLGRACNDWAQPRRVTAAIKYARAGFVRLNNPGWVAACDWQQNALAWTRPGFSQATSSLKEALAGMQTAGLQEFVYHCQLSLSYAQILIGNYDEAYANISACEAHFSNQKDPINEARCWLNTASALRRQARYDDALVKLEKAMMVFEQVGDSVDVAIANYQVALIHLFRTDDLATAIVYFEKAAKTFSGCDLDLWWASCMMNLGAIYMQSGHFTKADNHYQRAGKVFRHHNVLGLWADSLNDSGKLNTLRGKPLESVKQFEQAVGLYEKLGARQPKAIALSNAGEAYGSLGRYQDALFFVEQSIEQLLPIGDFLRLGTCEKYEAVIWSHLGRYSLAHEHLNRAEEYYLRTKQRALLCSIYNTRAGIFFEEGESVRAIESLEKSLVITLEHGTRPQAALSRRLLGEALLQAGQPEKAKAYLEQALLDSSEMGMEMDLVASLVALGICNQLHNPVEAKINFQNALQRSNGIFPELDWSAYAGLACLVEKEGDKMSAVRFYTQGSCSLAKIRLNFWQPSLAGSYLKASSGRIDQAVAWAVKAGAVENALQFIEANKATTLFHQLSTSNQTRLDRKSQELSDLQAEINWLQEQLRATVDRKALVQSSIKRRQILLQLVEKNRQYNLLIEQIERKNVRNRIAQSRYHEFEIDSFRETANRFLGSSWIALDYYLLDEQLIIAVIDACHFEIEIVPVTEAISMALRECMKACQAGTPPMQEDLELLGKWLIPDSIVNRLSPDMYLLLIPHKELHFIPWAAIRPDSAGHHLVSACIPVVVPSLNNLMALWQRIFVGKSPERNRGLLIGLSHFQGLHPALPYVEKEICTISAKLDQEGMLLYQEKARWESVRALSRSISGETHKPTGLSYFAWLHIASHVFADPHTGRLSGIAFHDGDIWLDQLMDLAPLPKMVTFSACNGIFSFRYTGDEHIGLATTCLAAGANQVVGSLWPVVDQASSDFMISFYDRYFMGDDPAEAAAKTQRQMIANGLELPDWAGFVCMGRPK